MQPLVSFKNGGAVSTLSSRVCRALTSQALRQELMQGIRIGDTVQIRSALNRGLLACSFSFLPWMTAQYCRCIALGALLLHKDASQARGDHEQNARHASVPPLIPVCSAYHASASSDRRLLESIQVIIGVGCLCLSLAICLAVKQGEAILHVTMCFAFQAFRAASWHTEGPNHEFGESS